MPIENVRFLKPDPKTSFSFTWKNFLKVAYPDASIWAINAGQGWYIYLAKADISAVLATERGEIKTYSKLETAIEQLRRAGFTQVITRDLRGMTND